MRPVLRLTIPFPVLLSLLAAGCATTSVPVPQSWLDVPRASKIRTVRYDANGKLLWNVDPILAPRAGNGVAVRDNAIELDGKPLTPRFQAVDSFDVSEERKEIVFSAKRAGNFDIGLVSIDGSDVHWVPEDPADETGVQWAPRGNKVSYIVRTKSGDLVRTVHIPTASQLTAAFPGSLVRTLAWEPAAERYAVVLESPEASPSVDVLEYDGEKRKNVVPPAARLDVEDSEPLGGGIVLRPPSMRYGEKLPLVVWIAENRYAWSDARAALLRNARVAIAIVTAEPDASFWTAARAVPWLDTGRSWLVSASPTRNPQPVTVIEPDATMPAGRYRRTDNRVLVAPPIVESFAAGFIANQVKGTPPANGSIR
ncbi:MAG: hypothetical protein JWO56_3257 [Acidobacteria bacterium]|nr:hypothetical protein [Acidobacteriota bacterium]